MHLNSLLEAEKVHKDKIYNHQLKHALVFGLHNAKSTPISTLCLIWIQKAKSWKLVNMKAEMNYIFIGICKQGLPIME